MSALPVPATLAGLLACALVAACGGTGTGSAPPAPAPADTPPAAAGAAQSCADRRARHDEAGGRIVGGEPARPGSAPWQVEILSSPAYDEADRAYDATLAHEDPCKIHLAERMPWELAHKCGGAWIGGGWIVTAAHCVDNIPGFDGREGNVLTDRRLRLGTQNLTVDDGLFAIDAVVIHAGYTRARKLDDIALVRVADDPRIARFEAAGRLAAVAPMGPGDRDLDPGEELRVTGWGWMGQRNEGEAVTRLDSARQLQRNPADLQQLTLHHLPDARCDEEYGAFFGPGALCAGALAADGSIEAGKDSCQGDSGGPLTREEDGGARSLVGVVSGGKGCGAGKPAVYTRIAYYAQWLADARQAAISGQVVRLPATTGAGSP